MRRRAAPARRGSPERRAVVCAGRRGLELRPHPDDGSFRVALGAAGGWRAGEIVAVRAGRRGRLEPSRRLGRVGDPELDFAGLCDAFALPRRFPEACERELREVLRSSDPSPRRDLSALPFVTIDPLRARDHDDAVFAERSGAGFRLWVAIADVARCVPAGSALDREARRRGNSVYLPDRVVPMLPEPLSADRCSLRPGETRDVVAVEIGVGADGTARRLAVAEARIRSRARLTYAEAAAVIERGAPLDATLAASLEALGALAEALRARRVAEGSLDLDLVEAEPAVDGEGRVHAIGPAARSVAHRAIEEAMLAANRAVAEWLVDDGWPALHRVHEPPDPQDVAALEPVLASLGLWPRRMRRAPGAEDLPDLAEATRGRPEAALVHGLLVRAMRQARYAERPLGHFALGFERYLHFTSPIRRYADLAVQRVVKARLAGGRPPRTPLATLAEHLSLREREAAQVGFQALDWKRAALLLPRVGEVFTGRVSAIVPVGLFVRLDAVQGDGLVAARALPRQARLDPRRAVVTVGRERLRIGDATRVRLVGVDPARGRFRLALAAYSEAPASTRVARRSHSG